MTWRRNGPAAASVGSRPRSVRDSAGRPVVAGVDERVEVVEEVLEVGRDARAASERRLQVVEHGVEVAQQRLGVLRRTSRRARASTASRRGTSAGSGSTPRARRAGRRARRRARRCAARASSSASSSRVTSSNVLPVLWTRLRSAARRSSSTSTTRLRVLGERLQAAERVVEVAAAPRARLRRGSPATRGTPCASARRRSAAARRTRPPATPAPSARRAPSLSVGASLLPVVELDVRLAEQRLLAQDRPRVGAQRRVLAVDLDRRDGVLASSCRRLGAAARAACRRPCRSCTPADADVGLVGERRRVGERDLHAVALRLERDRPAERQPEEQQQAEARQRERRDDEDPAGRGRRSVLTSRPPSSRPSLASVFVHGQRGRVGVLADGGRAGPTARARTRAAAGR